MTNKRARNLQRTSQLSVGRMKPTKTPKNLETTPRMELGFPLSYRLLSNITLYALLACIIASCSPVDTRNCSVLSDISLSKALLAKLRPVIDHPSKTGRIYSFDVMLERYEPVFNECEFLFAVTLKPITNPNSTTVFTGGTEQFIIYKNGGKVAGPFRVK